jgi:hypothetical protein
MKGKNVAAPRITNFEHRYTMWFRENVLPEFKTLAENRWPKVQEFIQDVLNIESAMLKNGDTPDH